MIKTSLLALTVIAFTVSLFTTTVNAQITSTNTGLGIQGSQVTMSANVGLGSRGSQVVALQKFLNTCVVTQVSSAGKLGGPGMETVYYGPATKSAVVRFQLAHGISPVGTVGPITRAKIETLQASGSPCTTTTTSTSGTTSPKTVSNSECMPGMGYSPVTGKSCNAATVAPTLGATSEVQNPKICTINNFSTDKSLIGQGDSVTLSWSTTGCASGVELQTTKSTVSDARATTLENVSNVGTLTVTPSATSRYVLKSRYVKNDTPVPSKSVTVTVGPKIVDVSPVACTVKFNADGTSLQAGQNTTLRWATTGCTGDVILISAPHTSNTTNGTSSSSEVVDRVKSTGTLKVTPQQTTSYTLRTNEQSKTVTITVAKSPIVRTCVLNSFTASNKNITVGQKTQLSWSVTGCSGGVQLSTLVGPDYLGEPVVDKVGNSGVITVKPLVTTTYELAFFGNNGDLPQTGEHSERVTVVVTPPVINCTIKFSTDDTLVNEGESTMLRWVASGCKDGTELHTTEITTFDYRNTLIENISDYGTLKVTPSVKTQYVITTRYAQNGTLRPSESVIVDVQMLPHVMDGDKGTVVDR